MVLDHLRDKVHRREKVEVVDCAPVPVAVPGAEPVAVPVPGAKPIEMTIPGVDPSEGLVYVPLDSLPPGTVVPMENGADLTAGATLPGNPVAQGNAPAPVDMIQHGTTAGIAGQSAVARGDHPGYPGAAPGGPLPPQAANLAGVAQPGAIAPQKPATVPPQQAAAPANGV